MKSYLFNKNLTLLNKKDPALAEAVNSIPPGKGFIVTPSQKGPPSLSRTFPDGKRTTIHSSYDPVKEARRFIDSCEVDNYINFVVLGLGLGYHIQELIKRAPLTSRIIIFEKDIEVLYCCMANIDFTSVIAHPGVSFQIGVDTSSLEGILESDRIHFVLKGYSTVKFQSLMNAELEYYSKLIKKTELIFKETKIDLKTKAAFSKLFYRNIFSNWKNILNSPGIHSLKDKYQGMPAIIVSAGPSLDKNISILKTSTCRAMVIAVATALRPLLRNKIKVDFVVAIDPEDSTIKFFDFENIPKKLWLVFDPCVPSSVVDKFLDRRIKIDSGVCLSHWIASRQEENNFLGKTFSVAHTALLFSRHLGCNPIILTGQDLSFNQNRLHCADSQYDQARKDKIGSRQTLKQLEETRYYEFASSFISVGDIFGKNIITTSALNMYKEVFADNVIGNGLIINATEGGLPIPGVLNMTLREALNTFCSENYGSRNTGLSFDLHKPNHFEKMNHELIEQSKRFDKVFQEIGKMKSSYLNSSTITDNLKKKFVRNMNEFYRFLFDQQKTLELMQGYSYVGFIEWNQQNGKIEIKEGKGPEREILEDKFQRDKKFLQVLEEAADTLRKGFIKMAEETNDTAASGRGI